MLIKCVCEVDSYDGNEARYYKAGETRVFDVKKRDDLPKWAIPLKEHRERAAAEEAREVGERGQPISEG